MVLSGFAYTLIMKNMIEQVAIRKVWDVLRGYQIGRSEIRTVGGGWEVTIRYYRWPGKFSKKVFVNHSEIA